MISSDIDASVSRSITLDMVIARMVELSERATQMIRDAIYDEIGEDHRKTASYSSCYCSYCSAIKAYVSAKRRLRRLDMGANTMHMTRFDTQRFEEAKLTLSRARARKDQMTARYCPPLSAVSLGSATLWT